MSLLHLDSSVLGAASVSRELSARIVEAWKKTHPGEAVVYRDLAVDPLPHLDGELVKVVKFRDLNALTPRQAAELVLTDSLVDEFLAAETVVIGAPMYNFSIPSALKAWLDRIAQAGKTFRYTEAGPEGLAGGRRVIIASARGGRYAGTPHETALDHQEAYLRTVFGFLGIPALDIVRAEGVSLGGEARKKALDEADKAIAALW